MSTQYLLIFLIFSLGIYSSYSEDSEDETENKDEDTTPSEDSYEDDLTDQGKGGDGDDGELPAGYTVLDGVVLDATNLIVQEVTANSTNYRMYKPEPGMDNDLYVRPKREAGWHFILFEDPQETSGMGHLILLQKLLGFTLEFQETPLNQKEVRLYEVFHVDLSNKFNDESDYDETDDDENGDDGALSDPNDSAEIVASKNQDQDGKIDEGKIK